MCPVFRRYPVVGSGAARLKQRNVDFRVGQPAIDRGFGDPPGAAAIIRATTTNTFHARARLGSNRVMDTAKLVERVKSILLSPKSEWPVKIGRASCRERVCQYV